VNLAAALMGAQVEVAVARTGVQAEVAVVPTVGVGQGAAAQDAHQVLVELQGARLPLPSLVAPRSLNLDNFSIRNELIVMRSSQV
jgi:hypothetical protein